jgi:hypothetical protein
MSIHHAIRLLGTHHLGCLALQSHVLLALRPQRQFELFGIEFELASTDVNANGFAELFGQALTMLYIGKHLALAVVQQVDVVSRLWRQAIL